MSRMQEDSPVWQHQFAKSPACARTRAAMRADTTISGPSTVTPHLTPTIITAPSGPSAVIAPRGPSAVYGPLGPNSVTMGTSAATMTNAVPEHVQSKFMAGFRAQLVNPANEGVDETWLSRWQPHFKASSTPSMAGSWTQSSVTADQRNHRSGQRFSYIRKTSSYCALLYYKGRTR
uniref:Uncharacterized protein n=1 Tax=Lygus hesperus TaxID=30085 RepID=A0A0K8T3T8_LYGHE